MEIETDGLEIPEYLAPNDDEMNRLLAAILDGADPEFRERLAGLIRAAYLAGAQDALEEDARQIVRELGTVGKQATSTLGRRFWNRAQTYRESNPEQIKISVQ